MISLAWWLTPFTSAKKIEWIEAFKNANNQAAPTAAQIDAGFSPVSNMPSQLDSYRQQAIVLIDSFLEATLTEKAHELELNIRDAAVIKAVNKSFMRGVWENIVAGLISSLITIALIGLAWVATKGPENLIREAIQNYTNSVSTAVTTTATPSQPGSPAK